MLKQLLERLKERKRMKEEYEDEDRVVHGIQERKKSHNERELEKYMNEEREKRILVQLKAMRKKRSSELWGSKDKLTKSNKNLINPPYLFKQKNIFK